MGGRHIWPGAPRAKGAGALSGQHLEVPYLSALPARLVTPGLPAFSAAPPVAGRTRQKRRPDMTCASAPLGIASALTPDGIPRIYVAWPPTIMAACTDAGSMQPRRTKSWARYTPCWHPRHCLAPRNGRSMIMKASKGRAFPNTLRSKPCAHWRSLLEAMDGSAQRSGPERFERGI